MCREAIVGVTKPLFDLLPDWSGDNLSPDPNVFLR